MMGKFDDEVRSQVKETIKSALRRKMTGYDPETKYMPFHTRLLGADRMHLYSFIHSLNTNFETAVFEPVAKAIAESCFASAETQYSLPARINSSANAEIASIVSGLTSGDADSDRDAEAKRVRYALDASDEVMNDRSAKADLRLVAKDGSIFLIDIKTVKPNAQNFVDFKRTLLHWYAKEAALHPDNEIHTAIALPYNPYHPEPYRRWTMRGMLDLKHEVYVAEEFWNFLAGDDVYDDLLDCFEEAGMELGNEIDAYFERYAGYHRE